MKTARWVSGLFTALLCGMAEAAKYPMANRVSVEVAARVSYLTTGTSFVTASGHRDSFTMPRPGFMYHYSIRSLPESEQNVDDVAIEISADVGATRLDASGIRTATSSGRHLVVAAGHTGGPTWHAWGIMRLDGSTGKHLLPGESIGGMFLGSRGLPGLRPFMAWGHIWDRLPNINDMADEDAGTGALVENPEALNFQTSGFRTVAVGPDVLPDGITTSLLLDRLAALKDQVASMGWIKDPGTVTSLNKKLAAARKALDRWFTGKRVARGILRAFVQELEAQRGKHVDENAYSLLRANADYLLEVRLK